MAAPTIGRVAHKVALVTGSGAGIGRATAILLANEGASVAVTDRSESAALGISKEIGKKSMPVCLDVAEEQHWQDALDKVLGEFGRLDILVNNAGIVVPKNLEKLTLAEWRHHNAINLDGVFLGTRFAIGAMKEHGGSIINIASVAANVGIHTAAAYCAGKGGVRAFTKAAALHCAHYSYSIRVNSVHPGYIRTPLVEGLASAKGNYDVTMQYFADLHPLKRLGEPKDVAEGILYLASDASRFVTGTELIIDGGYLAQ